MTGFYATQFRFDRAYGNYLGLCRLGQFMAAQLGLRFSRLVCHASLAQRGRNTKKALQPLADEIDSILERSEGDPHE